MKGIPLRYYYPEHIAGYDRIKAEGKTAWNEIHGQEGFDNFSSRSFLEAALGHLVFSTHSRMALEYGCGTGPGACFLAEHGFEVDAIDLVPVAIEIAKEIALKRSLTIDFRVADICCLPNSPKKYDLVVDSYCLQCIVFDDERRRVFSAVQSRLKPNGYYLVSSAIFDKEHEDMVGSMQTTDPDTGTVYNKYGTGLIDLDTGIVLETLDSNPVEYPDAIHIAGCWYLPHRRHLRASALEAELVEAGFKVVFHDTQHGGSMACTYKS